MPWIKRQLLLPFVNIANGAGVQAPRMLFLTRSRPLAWFPKAAAWLRLDPARTRRGNSHAHIRACRSPRSCISGWAAALVTMRREHDGAGHLLARGHAASTSLHGSGLPHQPEAATVLAWPSATAVAR